MLVPQRMIGNEIKCLKCGELFFVPEFIDDDQLDSTKDAMSNADGQGTIAVGMNQMCQSQDDGTNQQAQFFLHN